MAWTNLKAYIEGLITTNGTGDITGAILNGVLDYIVDAFGDYGVFAGIATPATTIPTPDGKVFWILVGDGTYSALGTTISDGKLRIAVYDSGWTVSTFDVYTGTKVAALLSAIQTSVDANSSGITSLNAKSDFIVKTSSNDGDILEFGYSYILDSISESASFELLLSDSPSQGDAPIKIFVSAASNTYPITINGNGTNVAFWNETIAATNTFNSEHIYSTFEIIYDLGTDSYMVNRINNSAVENTLDLLQYKFSTNTTDSIPASGYFKLNNSTQSSATYIFISTQSVGLGEVESLLENLSEGVKLRFTNGDFDNFTFRIIGAVTPSTGYVKIPIEIEGYNGSFSADEYVSIQFIPANIDTSLSASSNNPVQNSVIKAALDLKATITTETASNPSGIWTIDGNNKDLYFATNEVDITASQTIAFSNIKSGSILKIPFYLNSTAYTLSMPDDQVLMESTDSRWNSTTGVWTATSAGEYLMEIYATAGLHVIKITDLLTVYQT